MKKLLMQWTVNLLTKHLFKMVLEHEFLNVDAKGRLWYQGRQLSKDEVADLGEQARLILKQPLWMLLTTEMQHVAQKKMFHESKDAWDMTSGKLMLKVIEIMSKKLYNISKFD